MVVIDNSGTKPKVHENLNKSDVAFIVGVCRQTVLRWQNEMYTKYHGNYTIYLHTNTK